MQRRPEIIFICLALFFGLASIALTPPFQSPDETNHFHRTLHIASGNLMGKHLGNRLGGEIREDAFELSQHFDKIRKSKLQKFSASDHTYARNLERKNNAFADFANVGYYAPSVYLPQILPVSIGNLLNVKSIWLLYLGRIAGFLFWVLVLFQAIKWMPRQKHLFVFLALLPASISINSSLSGDVVSNALVFLFIAWVLKKRQFNESIGTKEFVFALVCLTLILVNKLVYVPIVLLILLLDASNFYKGKWSKILLMLIPVMIMMLWIPISRALFIPFDDYDVLFRGAQQLNEGVNPEAQLQHILSNPFRFIQISVLSYLDSAPSTWSHYIGKFGWDKNYIPLQMIALLSFVLALLVFTKEQTVGLDKGSKKLFIPLALMMIAAFTVSIYLQWSPVGNDQIWSLSGRYFIPIFPLLFLGMPQFKTEKRQGIINAAFIIVALANFSLLHSIYLRFY